MHARRSLACLLLLASATLSPAEPARAQELSWIRQFQTLGGAGTSGVAGDASGVYVAGWTWDALPGQVSAGGQDVFVRRYAVDGAELWTRQFGTSGDDRLEGIAADPTGAYVITSESGGYTATIEKLDPSGQPVWVEAVPWQPLGVATGGDGIFVVGTGAFVDGGYRGYLRKYDPNGLMLWAKHFSSGPGGEPSSVAADSTGVYVTTHGIAMRKFDLDGARAWVKRWRPPDTLISVSDGSVYVAWTDDVSQGGTFDCFIRKYDANGVHVWTRRFGTRRYDRVSGIRADPSGVFVTGETHGTFRGQTYAGGPLDAFVRSYDHEGTHTWTVQFGTRKLDNGAGLEAQDAAVIVVGNTLGTFPDQTADGGAFVAGIA